MTEQNKLFILFKSKGKKYDDNLRMKFTPFHYDMEQHSQKEIYMLEKEIQLADIGF